jgi:DNA-binding beta-propeller fold protein YncE
MELRTAGAVLLVCLGGCSSNKNTDNSHGNPNGLQLSPIAHGGAEFQKPWDATLSPDGQTAYFLALSGEASTVFSANASGETPAVPLIEGDVLSAPFGIDISTDGSTLFIADASSPVAAQGGGGLWTLDSRGGVPALLSETAGYAPKAVAVARENGNDFIYFSGVHPLDDQPGVFRLPARGGAPEAVFKGEPLMDPSGVAISRQGTLYVLDAAAEGGRATLYQVSQGQLQALLANLNVGYPAGIALSHDEGSLFLSALDADGSDAIYRLALGQSEAEKLDADVTAFHESAGLHRAHAARRFIWADGNANGAGIIFLLSEEQ